MWDIYGNRPHMHDMSDLVILMDFCPSFCRCFCNSSSNAAAPWVRSYTLEGPSAQLSLGWQPNASQEFVWVVISCRCTSCCMFFTVRVSHCKINSPIHVWQIWPAVGPQPLTPCAFCQQRQLFSMIYLHNKQTSSKQGRYRMHQADNNEVISCSLDFWFAIHIGLLNKFCLFDPPPPRSSKFNCLPCKVFGSFFATKNHKQITIGSAQCSQYLLVGFPVIGGSQTKRSVCSACCVFSRLLVLVFCSVCLFLC